MKLHALILLSVLASQAAYSQGGAVLVNQDGSKSEVKDFDEFMKNPQTQGAAGVIILSDKEAKKQKKIEAKAAKKQQKELERQQEENDFNLDEKKFVKAKSLDELEAESHELAELAKKKEQKSKELQEKSQKLAKKSDKFEDKSEQLAQNAEQTEDEAEAKLEESKKLAEEVENSEFKAQRDEALQQICDKKVKKAKLFGLMKNRNVQQDIAECVAEYKQSDLKKKTKIKQAHFNKQCTFNPGISIECPEGTYKFAGNDGLASVNAHERQYIKEVKFGENGDIGIVTETAIKK